MPQLRQIQQHHEGEGKVIDDAPQKAGAVQLDVLEAMNADALHRLPDRNVCAVQIFSGVAAQHVHGVACRG